MLAINKVSREKSQRLCRNEEQ